jgi:hypothetical protein
MNPQLRPGAITNRKRVILAWLFRLHIYLWLGCGFTFCLSAEVLFTGSTEINAKPGVAETPKAAKRTRIGILNTNASWVASPAISSRSSSLVFNLFDDLTVTGVLQQATSPGPGRNVLQGQVMGEAGSYFLLACESNVMAGTIFLPHRGNFKIQYAGSGLHRITEIDPKLVPICGVHNEVGSGAASILPEPSSARAKDRVAARTSAALTVVDVLVLYTDAARDGAGGDTGMATLIDLAVAEANTIYKNSQVNLLLHLAQAAKVPYQDSGTISVDLGRLVDPADGYLDEVPALRQSCHADLVCLLVENSDGPSGVAVQTANATNAYSVVQREYAVGYYVFAHELAHNFGCQHDRPDANTAGVFPYSYGWFFNAGGTTYGTVMSYQGVRIPYFSNPSVNFLGVPTGVATGVNAANNALTLSQRMQTVSAFSGSAATTQAPTVAITMPTNNASTFVGDNIMFTAVASDPAGGVSGVNFNLNGTLAGSSTGPVFQYLLTNAAFGDSTITATAVNNLGATTISAPVVLHVRYANDSFALRQEMSGTNILESVCNFGASLEPGEPMPFNQGDATVWFTWTAPFTGPVLYSLPGHDFSAFAAVYTGDVVSNLTLISGSPAGYPATFEAVTGETYQIAVGGYDNSTVAGHATLQWQEFPAFTNDDFTSAASIFGSSFHTWANNVGATAEPGEPSHYQYAAGHSVWWEWTAPANGPVQIMATGQSVVVAVYLGDTVSNLTRVVASGSAVTFNAAAGQVYHIAVDSADGSYSPFDLDLEFGPGPMPPINDDFVNAIPLVGNNSTFTGSTIGATREVGEPGDPLSYNTGIGCSVWWSWTASFTGQLSVDAHRTDAYVEVFTGPSIDQLTSVASGVSAIGVTVTPGTTYFIRLDSLIGPFTDAIDLSAIPSIIGVPNDDFANRAILTGASPVIAASNVGATKEPGEPNHGNSPGGQSVWFTWTAPADEMIQIKVDGGGAQTFYPLLGVYLGTNLTDLTTLGEAAFGYPSLAAPVVSLQVTNGMMLQIAVDGYNGFYGFIGATGPFVLKIISPPSNDDFNARQTIVGTNVVIKSSNLLATKEPGEPDHGFNPGGCSVWYSWMAPADGNLTINVQSALGPLTGVYTGNSLTNLVPIQSSANQSINFDVVGGTVYQIAFDDSAGSGGPFTLSLLLTPPVVRPVNDNFANRTAISGFCEIIASNTNATHEYGEPNHANLNGSKSVWWEWTSPVTGQITVDPTGSSIAATVAIYSGTELTNLTLLADSPIYPGSAVSFNAIAGQKYEIAVDAFEGNGNPGYGVIDLDIYGIKPPANDDFANRIMLTGASVSGNASNAGATREPGEPDHAGVAVGRSVWWSWVAPSSTLTSMVSGPGSCLAVYTGDTLAGLSLVASNAANGQLTFNAIGGTTYQIAVDSSVSNSVVGSITIAPVYTDPTNDFFASRKVMGGTNVSDSGYNGLATSEPSEPVLGFGRTLWWSWIAPVTGRVSLSAGDFDTYDTEAQVFLGNSVSNLTLVVAGNSSAAFTAIAGQAYQISLDSLPGSVGFVDFTLTEMPVPPNDDFTNATLLSGLTVTTNGSNLGATLEPGEPRFPDTNCIETSWWKWTAPETRQMTINVSGQTADFFNMAFAVDFAIYTGNSISNLTLVDRGTNQGIFSAVTGTTYFIVLDGTNGSFGNLNLNLVPTPSNDDFANRQVLQGYSIALNGDSTGATMEPGESDHGIGPSGGSVWFTWQAPASGPVTMTYSSAGFWAGLAIYTGPSLNQLTQVASSAFDQTLSFNAVAGTVYQIALAGYYGGTGDYSLDLWLNAGKSNDNFANRIPLSGTNLTVAADNTGATKQSGEPKVDGFAASHSLWWSYSSPIAGSLRINFSGVNFTPLIGVYTGTILAKLKPVTNITDYVKMQTVFDTFPGTNYQISVDGYDNATGMIQLQMDFQPLPPNDQFTNRLILSGNAFNTNASNRGATEEPGEPRHAGLSGSHSIWWTWTAPASEIVTLAVGGDGFSPHLAVYLGSTLKRLTLVASNYSGGLLNDSVTFNCQQGTNYQIAVDSDFGEFGDISLSLNPTPRPQNDDFENAAILKGSPVTATGSNVAATKQTGEPNHAGQPANDSIWWKWTPGIGGPVTIDTSGSSFDTVLEVYTGSTLSNLNSIAENDDAPDGGDTSQVNFTAIAGIPYLIAVDGFAGDSGSVQLNISGTNPPPLQLANVQQSPDGHFSFNIHGTPTQFFVLQTSTNLVDWNNISTNQFNDSVFDFTEPASLITIMRFYRVAPWP